MAGEITVSNKALNPQDAPHPAFLKQQGGALLVPTRVFPRSHRSELAIEADGLRVRLTAPPVEGAANEALIALLAERLGLPKRAVRVARGATGRQKMLEITGLSAEEFWRRLHPSADER
jgi:uncharacterized protein (TIGR00251 family)